MVRLDSEADQCDFLVSILDGPQSANAAHTRAT